jgi:hypothetical protein
MSTESPLDVQIPDDAIEATAQKLHELFGMQRSWADLSGKRKDVRRSQARELLLAAGYRNPQDMKAVGYAHCAQRAGAAVRLVSPDHITPMGERQILSAVEDNPYTRTPEDEDL